MMAIGRLLFSEDKVGFANEVPFGSEPLLGDFIRVTLSSSLMLSLEPSTHVFGRVVELVRLSMLGYCISMILTMFGERKVSMKLLCFFCLGAA